MYTVDAALQHIDSKIAVMLNKLKALQNADKGFKGFYCHDRTSGVWSTAEIVHLAMKVSSPQERDWLQAASQYLLACQNPDSGWPFRRNGKSITDVTAWCCLALSHFGYNASLEQGISFILRARNNEGESAREEAWGLTSFEQDRVYSTWIASYCLHRLLQMHATDLPAKIIAEMQIALSEARRWLIKVMNSDGSWAPTSESAPHITSTAVALLTLFMQSEDPGKYLASYHFLKSTLRHGLWPAEDEIVITREGYELPQQWFTSTLAFRAMIFYVELGLASFTDIDLIFRNLLDLVASDGGVTLTPHSSHELVWTIPYMIDALTKYRALIITKSKEYAVFLEKQREHNTRVKRHHMDELIRLQFPYPISFCFSTFQHELNYHSKFQLMLQLYELTIKYSTLVGLSGYLMAKESHDNINRFLNTNFRRPTLGDWIHLLEALANHSLGFSKLLLPSTGADLKRSYPNPLDDSADMTLSQALASIVALRNTNTGHGAIRTIYEYKLMIEREEGRLYSFFERMSFLAKSNSFLVLASEYDEFGEGDRYKIRIFKGLDISDNDLETPNRLSEGQRDSMVRYIYFQNTHSNTIVNLYPFLSYMFCDDCKREHFFFYNSMKGAEQISYLSYACGHLTERNNGSHFKKRLGTTNVKC